MEHLGWGVQTKTVGDTDSLPQFLETWRAPETLMCLWREEEEHGEEEREAAAGLVMAAEEDRWDRSKRRAAVRGVRRASRPEASSASRKTRSLVPAWLQSGPLSTWPQVLSVCPLLDYLLCGCLFLGDSGDEDSGR